jgi:DNA-binding MarR family transcriptional regulator
VPKSEIARTDGTVQVSPSVGEAMVSVARLVEYALAEADISATQYRILLYLRLGHTIQSDLAFQLAVSKQSVTRIVDSLVERRYLIRRVDPIDRRRVIHAITAKGDRALARTDQILEKYLMFILQDLDHEADVESAKEGLRLIARAALVSFQRVHPDGIVPGRLSSRMAPKERRRVRPI